MKLIKKIVTLLLIASMLLSLFACDKNKGDKNENGTNAGTENEGGSDSGAAIVEYSVTVLSPLGLPLSDVKLLLYNEADGADSAVAIASSDTNESGVAVFKLASGGSYSVKPIGYHSAYAASSDRYTVNGVDAKVVLAPNNDYAPKRYKLGDVMPNFTVSDIDGNQHELYDLLQKKDAVVLNFWFYGCGPCRSEFPALNTAYNSFKGELEVLAINDYPSESLQHVQRYESDKNLNLDFPLIRESYGSKASLAKFDSNGYPTTVVIDRYGTITFLHVGAVTNVNEWNKLFSFFTAEDYVPTVVNSFNDIA